MRYIRTKDGRIIDVEKFINEEKENPYYTDYKFEEIKDGEDGCYINWTAVGAGGNSNQDQIGRKCQFGATIYSPFIKQSDKIEDLCDEFILFDKEYPHDFYIDHYYEDILEVYEQEKRTRELYGAIWTDKGLIYVAKMNNKGEWELL